MENFVVSARKYRPQNFASVVGQAHITTTLKNAIKSNQLAHAFLFCGPRGVGKTTCARILAKTINCENRTPEGEACNECTSCKTFQEGQSLNIYELDAASNNSVDNIRDLTEKVRYAPQGGKYKVYIIDEVHMLSAQAFNAFLKTLEEPPSHAIFILATTEKHKILPTILSRCQVFDFKRMPTSETVAHLQEICENESVKYENDALRLVSQKSEGCMRDALSILDKVISFTGGELSYKNTLEHLNILDYEYFFKISNAVEQQDVAEALLTYDEILQKGFEGDDFLDGYSEFLRNLMVCKDKKVIHLMEVADNLKARYEELSGKIETGFLVSALNILNQASVEYRQSRNKRLLIEMTLIRLSYLQQAVSLISNQQTGVVSKKKVTDKNAKPVLLRGSLPLKINLKKGKNTPETATLQVEEEQQHLHEPVKKEVTGPAKTVPKTTEAKPAKDTISAAISASEKKKDLFGGGGMLDLTSIRAEIDHRKEVLNSEEKIEAASLEEEALQKIWKHHIEQLKEKDKKQAANILNLAKVQIVGEEEVEILCRNPVQMAFINDQKLGFAEELKKYFHNDAIQVSVKVDESLKKKKGEAVVLTQRQQLKKMMEKYPLIKELKEKLNLDLG